jgi:hypothetical protein
MAFATARLILLAAFVSMLMRTLLARNEFRRTHSIQQAVMLPKAAAMAYHKADIPPPSCL